MKIWVTEYWNHREHTKVIPYLKCIFLVLGVCCSLNVSAKVFYVSAGGEPQTPIRELMTVRFCRLGNRCRLPDRAIPGHAQAILCLLTQKHPLRKGTVCKRDPLQLMQACFSMKTLLISGLVPVHTFRKQVFTTSAHMNPERRAQHISGWISPHSRLK